MAEQESNRRSGNSVPEMSQPDWRGSRQTPWWMKQEESSDTATAQPEGATSGDRAGAGDVQAPVLDRGRPPFRQIDLKLRVCCERCRKELPMRDVARDIDHGISIPVNVEHRCA